MDASRRMEYLAYLSNRESYLKKLMEQGMLTSEEFDRIDQLQRQHYRADETEEQIRKEKLEKELALSPVAEPEPAPVHIPEDIPDNALQIDLARPQRTDTNGELRKEKRAKEIDPLSIAEPGSGSAHTPVYVSLTDMARLHEANPSYVIQRWLRSHNTIEFLQLWEEKNNPHFNIQGYELLKEKMELGSSTLTAKQWTEYTGAIGIQSKQGKGGGTFAHPDIAMDFQMWLKPELRLEMISDLRENRREDS